MHILYLLIRPSFFSCFHVLQNWGFSFNHSWRIFLSLLILRDFPDILLTAPLLPSSSAVGNPAAMPLQWIALCFPLHLLWPLWPAAFHTKSPCSNSARVLWESPLTSSPLLLPGLSVPIYLSYCQEDLRSQNWGMTVANIIHPWCVPGTRRSESIKILLTLWIQS